MAPIDCPRLVLCCWRNLQSFSMRSLVNLMFFRFGLKGRRPCIWGPNDIVLSMRLTTFPLFFGGMITRSYPLRPTWKMILSLYLFALCCTFALNLTPAHFLRPRCVKSCLPGVHAAPRCLLFIQLRLFSSLPRFGSASSSPFQLLLNAFAFSVWRGGAVLFCPLSD